jgi:D-alanine-D-alanine ligase
VRVAILFNDDGALAHGRRDDSVAVGAVVGCASAAAAACRELGWSPTLIAASTDPLELLARLSEVEPTVVLNLCESLGGDARHEAAVAGLLELAGLRYTGSPPAALTLALHKPWAKAVLAQAGVRVPRGVVLEGPDDPLPAIEPPWMVKPSREDASHGIDVGSVVRDAAAARARARELMITYAQPVIVEELVSGRELNISLLGDAVLPPGEIDFSGLPADHPPIVTYAAKWDEASAAYRGTPSIAARPLSAPVLARIEEVCRRAYLALGLRGYGRVDLRLDGDDPVVLEVNPNPDLSPDAGLARAAARAGLTYPALLERIVRLSMAT